MGKKIVCSFLIFFIICTQTACERKFNDFESEFMEQYYKIIQNIDSDKVDDIVYKLQSKENEIILENMNKILENNKDIRKKNPKKYDKFVELYKGLIALKEAYKKWESYDLDKQQYLNLQLTHIYSYLSILESNRKENNIESR